MVCFLPSLKIVFLMICFCVFQTLSGLHVLEAVEYILSLDDNAMKSAAIDIFSHIVEFIPSIVREFILKEGQKNDDVSMLHGAEYIISLYADEFDVCT